MQAATLLRVRAGAVSPRGDRFKEGGYKSDGYKGDRSKGDKWDKPRDFARGDDFKKDGFKKGGKSLKVAATARSVAGNKQSLTKSLGKSEAFWRFLFKWNRWKYSIYLFYAFPGAKPVSTFAKNALIGGQNPEKLFGLSGLLLSNVQIGDAERVFLNELAARFHFIAHQAREQ